MNWYAVGDLQGCGDQWRALQQQIEQIDLAAHWIFVGDLVNRGPRSLQTLRAIRALGTRARCVLGNHDLHLLAVASGIRRSGAGDTLDEILHAPDCEALLDWLRHLPLACQIEDFLAVHAGIAPMWDAAETLARAAEVETKLRGDDWRDFLRDMYGDQPDQWRDDLRGNERLRCIVNALTRMRWCDPNGRMLFKQAAERASDRLAWYALPQRRTATTNVVFGHWSARGLLLQQHLVGVDSGCVWGGRLSAVRLSDRALFQVECPRFVQPEA